MREDIVLFCFVLVMGRTGAGAFSSFSHFSARRSTSHGQGISGIQRHARFSAIKLLHERPFLDGNEAENNWVQSFDPMNLASCVDTTCRKSLRSAVTATTAVIPLIWSAENAWAAKSSLMSTGDLNPANFQPVCPASDGFYRFLQGTTQAVVGEENFVEYGPLIAGGLLRIRLELCVVESFFNEAVGPFIRENGISWILPLHETVETFLAGAIFSLATTFILVGSTKLLAVIITYADVFLGGPFRLFGGFAFDRARGKPVTLDIGFGPFKTRLVGPPDEADKDGTSASESEALIDFDKTDPVGLAIILASGSVKAIGEGSKILREVIEGLDLFVGRYLVLLATGYIGFKFLHFKVFPDFPPF